MYWADRTTREVCYCDLTTKECANVAMPKGAKPSAIAIGGNWLYFYDEYVPQEPYVAAVELNEGGVGNVIAYLRNRTSRVRNLKVFDPKLQTGKLFQEY